MKRPRLESRCGGRLAVSERTRPRMSVAQLILYIKSLFRPQPAAHKRSHPKATFELSNMPFSCFKCAKSFSSSTALTDHCRSTGHVIPCTTSGCKRQFTSQIGLKQHLDNSSHKNVQPNHPRGSDQQIYASSVRKDAKNSTSISHRKPSQSKNPVVLHETADIPEHNPWAYFYGYTSRVSIETTKAPVTYPLSTTQQAPPMYNVVKLPSQPRFDSLSQQDYVSLTLPLNEMPQPSRNTSLSKFSVPYSINDCYLVATPRNGNVPLVSSFVVDDGRNEFELVILVPESR